MRLLTPGRGILVVVLVVVVDFFVLVLVLVLVLAAAVPAVFVFFCFFEWRGISYSHQGFTYLGSRNGNSREFLGIPV